MSKKDLKEEHKEKKIRKPTILDLTVGFLLIGLIVWWVINSL